MRKELKELEVRHIDFRELKKDKKTVFFKDGPLDIYEIGPKDKIVLVDEETGKTRKRTVKNIRCCETLRQTIDGVKNSRLGLKWWEDRNFRTINTGVTIASIAESGIVGIELKRKMTFKRFVRNLFLLFLLSVLGLFLRSCLIRLNDQKINGEIMRLFETRPRYIFADIDASMIVTVKGNRIVEVTCRNEKCLKLDLNELLRDVDFTIGIKYLYEYVADKGYSFSKGIRLRSTENVVMDEELDFVFIDYITEDEEQTLLEEAIEKMRLVKFDEKEYYESLWKELKKDYQYDKVYTCSMDDDRLHCHFLEKAVRPLEGLLVNFLEGKLHVDQKLRSLIWLRLTEIANTLDKFNIPNNFEDFFIEPDYSSHIILDGEYYRYTIEYSYDGVSIENSFYYSNIRNTECLQDLKICLGIRREIAFSILELDLLNPIQALEDPKLNATDKVYSKIIDRKDEEIRIE